MDARGMNNRWITNLKGITNEHAGQIFRLVRWIKLQIMFLTGLDIG
jgi:hypothetical protein